MPKVNRTNFRIYLCIFYQIALVFAIIVAAIATYTAVKNSVIASSDGAFSREYEKYATLPVGNWIENIAADACSASAATAAFVWGIVVVLAALNYRTFKLLKTNNVTEIRKLNMPLLITLLVISVIACAVFAYDIISSTWINYYHFPITSGDQSSFADRLDSTIGLKNGVSFANIWNCTITFTVFAGLSLACLVCSAAFSAKTYNDWKITV